MNGFWWRYVCIYIYGHDYPEDYSWDWMLHKATYHWILNVKKFKSVFSLMQNEEIVNAGECSYNTNGLNVEVQ